MSANVVITSCANENDLLYLADHMYKFESDGKNPARWQCAKNKTDSCPVFLITKPLEGDEQSEEILQVVGTHNHEKDAKKSDDVLETTKTTTATKTTTKQESVAKVKAEVSPVKVPVPSPSLETRKSQKSSTLDEFVPNHVYLLVTTNGRELICVNGYLYRLEGKSKTSATFRWECIRSDVGCKMRIYTERIAENSHRLRQTPGAVVRHEEHEAYTPRHLAKLVTKQKMQIVDDGASRKWLRLAPKVQSKGGGATTKTKSHASLIPDYSMNIPKTVDPLMPPKDVIISKSMLGKKNFTIMPSAKGNRVLCVDNMIFHYDQASPCANRSYWTCLLRRDKRFKCKARLVMEESTEGLQIRKMSGQHNHADHSAKIDKRLRCLGLSREDIDNASITEIRTEPPQVPAKKKSISTPKVIEIPLKIHETDSDDDDDDDDFDEDDDDDEDDFGMASISKKLPQRLEEMRKSEQILTEDGLVTVERVDFSVAQSNELYVPEESYESTTAVECTTTATTTTTNAAKKRGAKRKHGDDGISWGETQYQMDVTKVSRLRSAKGQFLLCVDDYIYYMKREQNDKNHWVCIKNRDRDIQCKSFLTTAVPKSDSGGDIRVVWVTNGHNHPVCERDIKRRLCNELIASGAVPRKAMQFSEYFNKPLEEVKRECAEVLANFHNKLASEGTIEKGETCTMKLYAVSDGPPSLAVRMTLKALNIAYELKNVDYIAAEHMTESYAKMNPQKEIPVLDDDGFFLPESIAIMQYLCDKYAPDSELYPKEPTARALVNHRLCFNMGFYYAAISAHAMAPIFFDYPRNEMSLKKVKNALNVFETYLERNGTKYAAGEHVTLADFALVAATICLEGIGFDLRPWQRVKTWYEIFKSENPSLWEIAQGGMQEIAAFDKNPPDLSHMNHPFHPTRKIKS